MIKRGLKNFVCIMALLLGVIYMARGDDIDLGSEIIYKYKLIEELKKEITQIDSENARCQRAKNGWVAATVVGGVGVVATGTVAIIQASKLKDKPQPKKENKKESEKEPESQDGDK